MSRGLYFALLVALVSFIEVHGENPCNKYGLYLCPTAQGYGLEDSTRLQQNGVLSEVLAQPDVLTPYFRPESCYFEDHSRKTTIIFPDSFGQSRRLVLFRPENLAKEAPILFYIHGGGWYGGVPEWFERQARYFATRGIAVAALTYTLIPEGGTQERAVAELKETVEYLLNQAEKWSLDASRFGFSGESAGGYLSSYLAVTTPACCVYIGSCGLYDLTRTNTSNFPTEECEQRFFGTTDSVYLRSVSPQYLISKTTPYTLLMHGTADPTINVSQAENFAQAIRDAGGYAETALFEGYGHLYAVEALSDIYSQVWNRAFDFASKYFELQQ